jgi:hypothetical protein
MCIRYPLIALTGESTAAILRFSKSMHSFVANPHQHVTEVLPLRIKPFYIRHYLDSGLRGLLIPQQRSGRRSGLCGIKRKIARSGT